MIAGTKMQYFYHGFSDKGEPLTGNGKAELINFEFDSYQILHDKLAIVGINDASGSVVIFDAERCRVVTHIDVKASREAMLS